MYKIEEIVKEVQRGDKEKFELIIDRFQKQLFTYIYHLLGDVHEAEDAIQEVFIKAYEKINYYKSTTSFNAWLYKLAYNHSINIIRRKNLIKMIPIFDFSTIKKADNRGTESFYGGNLSYYMEKALSKLSIEERNLIILRILEEKSYKEIGMILDKKPSTLRKRFERAKKKLQRYYKDIIRGTENEKYRDRVSC